MTERPFLPLEEVLTRALGDLTGLSIADIGAGSGRVTRLLASLGAEATGVEPNPQAVAAAQAEGGGPAYTTAPGEATGLPAGAFDMVLFSESLHHAVDIPAALNEAARIAKAGGRIAVLEPEAPDPMWPVARWIDDESAVYAEAQAAIDALCAQGRASHASTLHFAQKYHVATPDQLIEDMCAVDPSRSVSPEARQKIEAAFAEALTEDADGSYLAYWERIDVLSLS